MYIDIEFELLNFIFEFVDFGFFFSYNGFQLFYYIIVLLSFYGYLFEFLLRFM